MAYSNFYETGTVTVSANGTALTGTGTEWVTAGVVPGAAIFVAGHSLPLLVRSVTSETTIVLDMPAPQAATGAAYVMLTLAYDAPMVELLRRLLNQQTKAFDLDGEDKSVTLDTDTGSLWQTLTTATTAEGRWRWGIATGDFGSWRLQRWTGSAWADTVTIDRTTGVAAFAAAPTLGGNALGVGVAAHVHRSVDAAVDIGATFSVGYQSGGIGVFSNNQVLGVDGGRRRLVDGYASMVSMGDGGSPFKVYAAPSGSAGATATFAQVMTIDAYGRLGIGTATPSYVGDFYGINPRLRVQDAGTGYVLQQAANGSGSIYTGIDSSAADAIGVSAYSRLLWSTGAYPLLIGVGGAERLRVKDTGEVGIGTTSPSVKLHVAGAIRTSTYTVATLPSASSSGAGARAAVTDSNASTFGSIVAGGGSTTVPVYSDGTNWRIG